MIEKPSFRQLVNAGMYALKPNVIDVKEKDFLDMEFNIIMQYSKKR